MHIDKYIKRAAAEIMGNKVFKAKDFNEIEVGADNLDREQMLDILEIIDERIKTEALNQFKKAQKLKKTFD